MQFLAGLLVVGIGLGIGWWGERKLEQAYHTAGGQILPGTNVPPGTMPPGAPGGGDVPSRIRRYNGAQEATRRSQRARDAATRMEEAVRRACATRACPPASGTRPRDPRLRR